MFIWTSNTLTIFRSGLYASRKIPIARAESLLKFEVLPTRSNPNKRPETFGMVLSPREKQEGKRFLLIQEGS